MDQTPSGAGAIASGRTTPIRTAADLGADAFRRLFEASPTPFLVLAPDAPRFTITDVNEAYLAATMRTRAELIGASVFEAFPDNPDDPAATGASNLRASLERALASKASDHMGSQRYDVRSPQGGFVERWWAPINTSVVDESGEVIALIHHVSDITERKATEEARDLLMREVDHRARNALTVIQSVARLTDASDAGAYRDALLGRIDAMARAQSSLARTNWRGATIGDLLQEELGACAGLQQLEVGGPPVPLPAEAVQAFGMIVHELATNAVKYGALSTLGGRLAVHWRSGPLGAWTLTWSEQTERPTAPPQRRGFGARLIARLARQIGATATFRWRPVGLEFELTRGPR